MYPIEAILSSLYQIQATGVRSEVNQVDAQNIEVTVSNTSNGETNYPIK
jgi:hypothetical protein